MKRKGKLVLASGAVMVVLIAVAGLSGQKANEKEFALSDNVAVGNQQLESNNNTAEPASTKPTAVAEEQKIASLEAVENLAEEGRWFDVVRVVDGDTLAVNINGVAETIRIIGINTPETVDPRKPVECFGKEASDKAKSILEGKKIRLEADPGQGERDKYDRLLKYVFLENGTDFGKIMIEQGFAYEYTYDIPYKYQAEYKEAEKLARDNKRGLWADGVCQEEAESTQSSEPVIEAVACDCSGNVYNCPDFKIHNEAQSCFEYCKQQGSGDIHKLDSDKDGIACESLPDK